MPTVVGVQFALLPSETPSQELKRAALPKSWSQMGQMSQMIVRGGKKGKRESGKGATEGGEGKRKGPVN